MSGLTFSEGEMKLMANTMLSFKGEVFPEVDYDKLAELNGNTKGSAKVLWGRLRRKIVAGAGGEGEADGEVGAATPKKTPKKRAAAEDADGVTPKKKGRKSKAEKEAEAAAAAAAASEDSEEQDAKKIKGEEEDED